MQFKSVEEQIVHGTNKGVPVEQLRARTPDRVGIACRIFNAGLEAKLESKLRTSFEELIDEYPWIIYWLNNPPLPVPVGVPNGRLTVNTFPTNRVSIEVRKRIPGWTDREDLGLWLNVQPRPNRMMGPVPEGGGVLVSALDKRTTVERMEAAYLQSNFLLPAAIEMHLQNLRLPGETTYSLAVWNDWISTNLTFTQIAEFDKLYNSARSQCSKQEEFEVSENSRCAQVFAKLGPNATNLAVTELQRRDWHQAYTIINARYLEKGIGDIAVFELEARSIKMYPGQPLQEHIARLQESLKQWATVMFLSAESIRTQGVMDHIQINLEQSTANSGTATDAQIRDAGFTVFIPEESRYDIYEKSVDGIKRFEGIIMMFSLKERFEKSVRQFLTALENMEKSSKGQLSFRQEVDESNKSSESNGNPNKKRSALVTTPGKDKTKKEPQNSCKWHPGRKVAHTEKECKLNPANSAGDKKKSGDNSSPKNPCTWCSKHKPKLAKRHGNATCWFNPASPAYDPAKANDKSNASPAINSDMSDRLHKLETNSSTIKALLSKLSKSSGGDRKRVKVIDPKDESEGDDSTN